MKLNRIHALLAPACLAAIALAAPAAQAQTVETLDFGWQTSTTTIPLVGQYFNGGTDSLGPRDGTGPGYGVAFGANAESLIESASTTTSGKFENLPSGVGSGVLAFVSSNTTAANDAMNVAEGFTALAFNYALSGNSATYDGTVNVYSGLNGTGSLLASIALGPNGTTTSCTSTSDHFCSWSLGSASNFGVAESAVFVSTATTAANTELAGITITAVPEPGSFALMAAGLMALCGVLGVRRRD
jgi:hypothetical protein